MKITRKSPVTGIELTLDLPCTEEQYSEWERGGKAQYVFPTLNADQREFIISGCTPQDWDDLTLEEDQ